MALYYPQRTTLELGPTGLLPGRCSHNVVSSIDCMAATGVDQPLTVEAGSVAIVHGEMLSPLLAAPPCHHLHHVRAHRRRLAQGHDQLLPGRASLHAQILLCATT